jgi:hypothetical protein
MVHFPENDNYRWLELSDDIGAYGHAAFKERGDALEVHLTLARWGPSVRRQVRDDSLWVKKEAKRLEKRKILGVRADTSGNFDPNLFRFARLFGFTNFCVLQTMEQTVE